MGKLFNHLFLRRELLQRNTDVIVISTARDVDWGHEAFIVLIFIAVRNIRRMLMEHSRMQILEELCNREDTLTLASCLQFRCHSLREAVSSWLTSDCVKPTTGKNLQSFSWLSVIFVILLERASSGACVTAI